MLETDNDIVNQERNRIIEEAKKRHKCRVENNSEYESDDSVELLEVR